MDSGRGSIRPTKTSALEDSPGETKSRVQELGEAHNRYVNLVSATYHLWDDRLAALALKNYSLEGGRKARKGAEAERDEELAQALAKYENEVKRIKTESAEAFATDFRETVRNSNPIF